MKRDTEHLSNPELRQQAEYFINKNPRSQITIQPLAGGNKPPVQAHKAEPAPKK